MKEEYITIYAIVPSEIYNTKELTAEEKLIAERITALCKKEGFAWISNKALAELYGIREDTVSKHIKKLKEYGYIKCIYDKTGKGKSQRTIYLTNNIWDKSPIYSSLNNQKDIGYTTRHNKYSSKNIIEDNINKGPQMSYDVDGVMLWNGKRCEVKPSSKEEQEELDKIFDFSEVMNDKQYSTNSSRSSKDITL